MARVIYALCLRETKVRYGRLKIGYLWAFLEPMLYVTVLAILFSYGKGISSGNMPPILFFTTGVLTFILFRDIMMRTMSAVQANYQLLTFPQVHVFDIVIARALLEITTFFIVFTVLVSTVALLNIEPVNIESPLRLLEGVALTSLMGMGAGFATVALVPLFPTVQFLVSSILIRPLFFLSGIFFTVDVLPEKLRHYALYNPLLHISELMRSAFFHEFESQYIDMSYIIKFTLCILVLGMLLQRALKRHAMRIPI